MNIQPQQNLPPKSGQIVKSASLPSREQMALINQYTRRTLAPEELFCFGVVLCDNDIDRDLESFTVEALHSLRELFLGKTGIFDHDPKGSNQTARIYDTEIRTDHTRKSATGEPYTYLFAQAYTVRSEKNADFILEIDAGIKKEVSVGCSVSQITCSICGTDWKKKSCAHTKGADYGGKPCYAILSHPTDAYEWSFVAIPAQKNAGVIKRFSSPDSLQNTLEEPPIPPQDPSAPSLAETAPRQKEHLPSHPPDGTFAPTSPALPPLTAAQWIHKLAHTVSATHQQGALTLSREEVRSLQEYLSEVEEQTALAKQTIQQMRERVSRVHALHSPEVPPELIKAVVQKMSLTELTAFDSVYRTQSGELQLPPMASTHPTTARSANEVFKTTRSFTI